MTNHFLEGDFGRPKTFSPTESTIKAKVSLIHSLVVDALNKWSTMTFSVSGYF